MPEARIGRLLVASLHQAIVDVLPDRVDFYEYWLGAEGLRGGQFTLAQTAAVAGFLRTEGDGYARVMDQAGNFAAEWTLDAMSSLRRRLLEKLPRRMRALAALRIAASAVRTICSTSRVKSRIRGDSAQFDVKTSLFCDVREIQRLPLCSFYGSLAAAMLTRLGLPATAHVEHCRAVDGESCVIALNWPDATRTAVTPLAA